ncbi:MAG: hypothetical protein V4668_03815 [Patescibacteria group bacterium]
MREFVDAWREIWNYTSVTEDMVYEVIPTTWTPKADVKQRLLERYKDLNADMISEPQIYSVIRLLQVNELIECDYTRTAKMHHLVGICRKKGPSRPVAFDEKNPVVAYA